MGKNAFWAAGGYFASIPPVTTGTNWLIAERWRIHPMSDTISVTSSFSQRQTFAFIRLALLLQSSQIC